MKDLFKRMTASIIASSVVAFIIGLVMAVVPNISLQVIGIMVGIYAIVHGIALICLDFAFNNIYIPFYGILTGILSIILGIVLLAMPNVLSTVFGLALGIWIILSSVNIISTSVAARKTVPNWWVMLILGILDLIAGVLVLFNPFASSISVIILGGIIIMVHSVVTIADMIMVRKDAKDMAKAFESSFKQLKA